MRQMPPFTDKTYKPGKDGRVSAYYGRDSDLNTAIKIADE